MLNSFAIYKASISLWIKKENATRFSKRNTEAKEFKYTLSKQ